MSTDRISNVSVNNVNMIEDKLQRLDVVSEDWLVVDKSGCHESTAPCPVPNENKNVHGKPSSVQNLSPYVPFLVEELAFTTRLNTWSNCNVRVTGLLQMVNGVPYIESIDETGGPYKILLDFEHMDSLPSSNQVVQVFGKIKISQDSNDPLPFIKVLFFRNIKSTELPVYIEAIKYMRQYIPLFLKAVGNLGHNSKRNVTITANFDDDDDNNDRKQETALYSDDDFNHAYNTDYLF